MDEIDWHHPLIWGSGVILVLAITLGVMAWRAGSQLQQEAPPDLVTPVDGVYEPSSPITPPPAAARFVEDEWSGAGVPGLPGMAEPDPESE